MYFNIPNKQSVKSRRKCTGIEQYLCCKNYAVRSVGDLVEECPAGGVLIPSGQALTVFDVEAANVTAKVADIDQTRMIIGIKPQKEPAGKMSSPVEGFHYITSVQS